MANPTPGIGMSTITSKSDVLAQRLLEQVKLFDGFTKEEALRFLANSERIMIKPRQYVIREGEQGRNMYIILSGEVEVLKTVPDLVEKVLARLKPGDTFGEMSLLDSAERSASVRCATDCLLLIFNSSSLLKMPELAPKLYRNIALMLAQRLRGTDELITLILKNLGS